MVGGWVRPSLRFENDRSGARDESNMRLLVSRSDTKRDEAVGEFSWSRERQAM